MDIFLMSLSEDWYRKLPHDASEVAKGYIHKTEFYNQIPRPTWGININRDKPLLNDRNIRQGIQFAMNWEVAIREVFQGDATRMQTCSDGYAKVTFPDVKARPFDIKAAEQAFAKSGFARRGPDGVFVNDKGQRLSFTLTSGYKRFTDVFTILKKEAIKAGLELNLEIIELTSAWKKSDEKKHELIFGAKNVSPELYPRFRETFHGANAHKPDGSVKTDTNNETQTDSKELDAMIDAYDKAENMEDIVKIARQIVAWVHEDAAFVPAWVQPYYRTAYWRWMCWPKGWNARISRDWEDYHLFWIEEEIKADTLAAMKEGRTFPPGILVFDQWKEKNPA
jgi:microcin C transport system substrate-binding protein